eukprot:m.40828 g.40828  ORF g.40828 m.40828 type:complete len:250 (-) comp9713_c0_seq4:54-803(-)
MFSYKNFGQRANCVCLECLPRGTCKSFSNFCDVSALYPCLQIKIYHRKNGERTLYSFSRGGQPGIKLSSIKQLIDIYQDNKMGEPGPLTEYVPAPKDGDGHENRVLTGVQGNSGNRTEAESAKLRAEEQALFAEMRAVGLNSVSQETNPFLAEPSTGHESSIDVVGHQAENLDESEVWYCSACTFANHSVLPNCEMCEAPRVASPSPTETDASNPFAADMSKPKRANPFMASSEAASEPDRQRQSSGPR